jgi:hypothetical protein
MSADSIGKSRLGPPSAPGRCGRTIRAVDMRIAVVTGGGTGSVAEGAPSEEPSGSGTGWSAAYVNGEVHHVNGGRRFGR